MEILEAVKKAIQEFIVPELEAIRNENKEIKARLELTNKRLDDVNRKRTTNPSFIFRSRR
jgi:rRNA-processing protein FCF1